MDENVHPWLFESRFKTPNMKGQLYIYWKKSMYTWKHSSNLCCSRVNLQSCTHNWTVHPVECQASESEECIQSEQPLILNKMGETNHNVAVSFLQGQEISISNTCHSLHRGLWGTSFQKLDLWDCVPGTDGLSWYHLPTAMPPPRPRFPLLTFAGNWKKSRSPK